MTASPVSVCMAHTKLLNQYRGAAKIAARPIHPDNAVGMDGTG